MCDPGTAALVIGIVSAVASNDAQRKTAHKQEDAAKAQLAADNAALDEKSTQVDMQAKDQMSIRHQQAIVEQARLRTIQGESGLSGVSNDRIMANSYFNEGTDLSILEGNRQADQRQIDRERQGAGARSQTARSNINQPNDFATGLQIASAGNTYYQNRQSAKRQADLSI